MSEAPKTIGRYRVERALGRGAMGVVYLGHDPEIDRPVAIKLVRVDLLESEYRDDYLARFRQEVQAAGRCMHRNIVAIYDFGSHEANPFFVMEYVDALPMDQAVPKGVGLGPHAATPIVLQLLDALACAHRLGVVHRDIKPSNLLLTAERQVKVMDFGISRISTSHLTQTGSVLGTPRYMSPEQFRGDRVDARSDLFSTGAVLHELLTGRPAVEGRSTEEIMVKLLHDGISLQPPNALMPAPIRAVVAKAVALKADDRFESADAMATALRRALAEVEARGDGASEQEARTVMMPSARQLQETPPAVPASIGDPALADSEVLSSIEHRLAQHIGPLAGRLVRDALKSSDTVDGLCQKLAQRIESEPERDSFLRDVRSRVQSLVASRPAGAGLTPEVIGSIQRDLTRYLGPFAAVAVKRTAPLASSPSDLRQRLSGYVDDPKQRDAFLNPR